MSGMSKYLKKHKKYGLLWNYEIEDLYYDKGEERMIEMEKDGYYLLHDVPVFNGAGKLMAIQLRKDKIIQESDNLQKLKDIKKKKENEKNDEEKN